MISVKSGEGTNEARARWAKPRGESPMSKEVRQAKAMADDHCELWSAVAGERASSPQVWQKYFFDRLGSAVEKTALPFCARKCKVQGSLPVKLHTGMCVHKRETALVDK